MNKKIKIGVSILLIIIMISVHISYAKVNQNEEDFFKVNKEEISPEETLEMAFDISSLKYNEFEILLKSNVDSEDIYTESGENVSIDNNENAISIDVDKEKISLSEIKLYYPIPKEMEIGTKIQFTAQIIVNNEIKEENQITNIIDNSVTNELEMDNNIQNLENEINQDNNTQEEVVLEEITKTITVVEKKLEDDKNSENTEQSEEKNKNPNENNNEQDSESKIPNTEKNNSNQEKNNTQSEETSFSKTSNQDEKISTSKTNNQNEKIFSSNTSNQKISINTNIGSNSGTNSEPQVTYNGSNNNYLSKLEIEGIELNTSFNKENQTYFAKTNSVSAINIVATAEDSTAKINIAGNDNIQNGNNKILISVTAENGDVRYYRIFVNCEEGTDETQKKRPTTLNENSEVTSAISENVELHATYYLSEVCVEEKQFVEKGANILKYTNGEYLTAPYDCYIVELNLPEIEGKCLNSHYVQIESKNMLSVSMKVDETQINNVDIGKEATIEVTAIDKKYTGYITHIGSIATNGKFDVTIEFENDGNVMIGMTAGVEITI